MDPNEFLERDIDINGSIASPSPQTSLPTKWKIPFYNCSQQVIVNPLMVLNIKWSKGFLLNRPFSMWGQGWEEIKEFFRIWSLTSWKFVDIICFLPIKWQPVSMLKGNFFFLGFFFFFPFWSVLLFFNDVNTN